MTLGEKIQQLRRKHGMSQDELAEKLDVSRQAISKWERDEAIPETEKIIRIAQEFNVSTDYLLLDREFPPQADPVPPQAPPRPQEPSAGQQVLRGIRRHGYKTGYVMMAAGAGICVIALLIMLFVPGMGSGIFGAADSFTDSAENIVADSGFGGFSPFGGIINTFDQQVDQMETLWHSGTTLMAMMIAIPLLLLGAALFVGGIIVVVKGRKIALNAK